METLLKMDKMFTCLERLVVMILLPIMVFLTASVVTGASDVEPTACKTEIQTRKLPSYYSINNNLLKSETFEIKVSEDNEDDCFINVTEIIPKMAIPTFPILKVIGIECKSHKRVYVTEYEGQRAKHIVFHVQIKLCVVDMNNLNNLLKIGDARVLLVSGIIERREENVQISHENALKGLVTFLYDNKGMEKQNFSDIFNETSSYPILAEIVLKNITFDVFPIQMTEVFPNLQSLELPDNDLTMPPQIYPWAIDKALLPRNLSRSPLMQNHYIDADYIEIPSNEFRRYLNLDGNAIHNLSEYMFHGHIDKISIKWNELHTIGDNTFRNVSQLQHLDLSNNMLTEVPRDAFKGMRSLRKLELSGNQIQLLLNGIFDDLQNLRFLSLANNSVESIPTGVFEKLRNLEFLRLERNELININPHSFPLGSVKLNEVHFQFNPIIDLPHFLFYIRSIQLANFHATHIAFNNFTNFLERFVDFQVYATVVDSASNADHSNLLERAEVLRKIDISDCNITNLHLTGHITPEIAKLLKVLLLHFEFDLTNNPINCNCDINSLVDFIQTNAENGTISKNEYFFNDWTCQSPTELNGKNMLSVKPAETYCEISIATCPQECTCYERATVNHIIVDCRNKQLNSIHRYLPGGKLELWYSGNNITSMISFSTPKNVIVLDVSNNKIETISGDVIKRMTSIKVLSLNSNVLAYIPQEITSLNLEEVNLVPNPLTCDCQTLWMKNWLEKNKHVIRDWDKVACKIENEDGMVLIEVPDDKFICNEDFDDIKRVVLPSVICSVLTLLLVILCVLLYAYRLECKVLMFVYFGIHPFDKDSHKTDENLDCVIVHSGLQTDWVMENIVSMLENKNYEFVVCDMSRDFVIGYSFQENLTKTVRHSKRIIFCLSEDWKASSDSFTTAWRIAQEKIKDTRSHYGIIVSHEINKSDVQDKDLRRFVEQGRFVDSKDRLFGNKIVYYMPQIAKIKTELPTTVHFRNVDLYISKCFINNYCEDDDDVGPERENQQPLEDIEVNTKNHAFISYHDKDFQYVLKELLPFLEEKGFSYCIADRDFVPGASVEENILSAINRCQRTIFILSSSHVEDEWSLFTFRAAYEKALREKSNHLLVIVKEEVEDKYLDEEMRHYLKHYICLNVNDRWFEKKLYNGLPLLRNRQDLHTSALILRRGSVNEADVTIEVD